MNEKHDKIDKMFKTEMYPMGTIATADAVKKQADRLLGSWDHTLGMWKSNGLSALSIGNDEISIIIIAKKSEEGLRIMNIIGEIGTIAINTKGSTVKCKKIGSTWIPEEPVFIEKTSSITVEY